MYITTQKITAQEQLDRGITKVYYIHPILAGTFVALFIITAIATIPTFTNQTLVQIEQ